MVNWLVVFSKQAERDKKLLKAAGLEEKTKTLLKIIRHDPYQNPPPYEKLVGNLSGLYSRRINIHNRLVYEVIEGPVVRDGTEYQGAVKVLRMWTHYE